MRSNAAPRSIIVFTARCSSVSIRSSSLWPARARRRTLRSTTRPVIESRRTRALDIEPPGVDGTLESQVVLPARIGRHHKRCPPTTTTRYSAGQGIRRSDGQQPAVCAVVIRDLSPLPQAFETSSSRGADASFWQRLAGHVRSAHSLGPALVLLGSRRTALGRDPRDHRLVPDDTNNAHLH